MCTSARLCTSFPADSGMRMRLAARCYSHTRTQAARLHSVAATSKPQPQAVEETRRPHAAPGESTAKVSTIRKDGGGKSIRELLTRDFIAKSLYNQENGYFSTKDVINDLPGPLEFGSMMGELHYRLDVKKVNERTSAVHVSTCGNSPTVKPLDGVHVRRPCIAHYVIAACCSCRLPNKYDNNHDCPAAVKHGSSSVTTVHQGSLVGGPCHDQVQVGWPPATFELYVCRDPPPPPPTLSSCTRRTNPSCRHG